MAKSAGLAIGAGLVVELGRSVRAAREAEKVTSQTAAVIKSTGKAAKVTAGEVEQLANAISLKAGIDDEAIQSAENLLLTFKNIRNETGKGNQIFNQATQVVTDMSVALGTDLKSASIQVGKALNDPTIGLSALQRVGVTFTAQQKEQIVALYEGGKAMKAQKMILKELKSEFGGSAKAQADPFDKAKVAVENLEEALGKLLLPTLGKGLTAVAKFANQLRTGKGAGGDFRRELEKFKPTLKTIGKVAEDVWPILRWQIKAAWDATKFVVKNMTQSFNKLVGAGKTMVGAFKSVWGGIKDVWRGGVSAIEGFVNSIIDIINLIPGVDIGHVGGSSGSGKDTSAPGGTKKKGSGTSDHKGHFKGGLVTTPSAFVGEEAPQHPEYVLATNPAYRARNVKLWQQAGSALGVPGFALGGLIENTPAAKLIGGLPSPGDLIGKLPNPSSLPSIVRGTGAYAVGKAKDYIKEKLGGLFGSGDLSGLTNAGRALIPIGRELQRQGYQVGEHPAFGGVQGVHTAGSLHYQGRAIDVNRDGKGQAFENRALDALYNTLRPINPTELLWRTDGHFDHLHLGFRKGGIIGSPARGSSWINAGSTFSPDEAATLAWQVGASPREAKLLSTKIIGESGGRPGAVGHDPGGTQGLGLWQITTGFNDDLISRFGGRSAMLHPSGVPNAKAALAILRRQGIDAWYAPSNAPGRILHDRVSGPLKTTISRTGSLTSKGKPVKGGKKPGKGQGSGVDPNQALIDQQEQLIAALQEQNALMLAAQNLGNSEVAILKKAIADVASGAIGGKLGLGFASPSYAGGLARY